MITQSVFCACICVYIHPGTYYLLLHSTYWCCYTPPTYLCLYSNRSSAFIIQNIHCHLTGHFVTARRSDCEWTNWGRTHPWSQMREGWAGCPLGCCLVWCPTVSKWSVGEGRRRAGWGGDASAPHIWWTGHSLVCCTTRIRTTKALSVY